MVYHYFPPCRFSCFNVCTESVAVYAGFPFILFSHTPEFCLTSCFLHICLFFLSFCAQWWLSCCIISSCQHLPGCLWRLCTFTACRLKPETSTMEPWGFTTPSAGECLLSLLVHTAIIRLSVFNLHSTNDLVNIL